MSPNSNFKDLLNVFNRCGVEYLVVGGYAVMFYTEPRFTKDLDLWVRPSAENANRVFRALAEFGAPLAGIQPGDFAKEDTIYQLGVPPVRIDVVTSITSVTFEEAWPRRKEADFDDVAAHFISLGHLRANKSAVGRASDLADVERLIRVEERE